MMTRSIRRWMDDARALEMVSSPKQQAHSSPTFVVQSIGFLAGHADCYAMTGLAKMHAILHIRTICFVHFFSGVHSIDHRWVQGAVQVFCLSIEYCIQNANGDLTAPANRKWRRDRLCSGALMGSL